MNDQKWIRSSLRQVSKRLTADGHPVSHETVGRLLKDLKYALHVNAKKVEAKATHPDRNAQFDEIARQRQTFGAGGLPIISVDTKKKELIGNFKNSGSSWSQSPEAVNAHDFPQDALGRATPYGIYDLTHNRGTVYVGTSADTPQFAVDVLAHWWQTLGSVRFPLAKNLLILADAGGSNGCRPRLWKQQLQEKLADRFDLHVTVCHYPTGCSKWNPIEHRLFSQISLNWAGKPLRTWDTILAYLRGTTTSTGLQVDAFLHEQVYQTGLRVSTADMKSLNIELHPIYPKWNYTIHPRQLASLTQSTPREVIS